MRKAKTILLYLTIEEMNKLNKLALTSGLSKNQILRDIVVPRLNEVVIDK